MTTKTKKSTYVIGGLKDEQCRDRIEHTISSLEGVGDVEVNLNTKKVTVQHDPSVIASGYIEETLQSLGYSIQG
jgi:copper chaperone